MILADQICSVDGCLGKSYRRGMCMRHEKQERKNGRIIDFDRVMDLPGEQWKLCYESALCSYFVSNMGRVKSINGREKLIKPQISKRRKNCGVEIHLAKCAKGGLKVASEVIHAFVPNPYGEKKWIYLDGDRTNCRADNLQWYGAYWFNKSRESLGIEARNGSQDAADIVAFMDGDGEAINRILEARRPKMVNLIKYLGSYYSVVYNKRIDAEAITQEALIRAIYAIKRGLLKNTSSLSGWFSRLAKNEMKNQCSRKRVSETSMFGQYGDSGDEYDVTDRVVHAAWREEQRRELVSI